MAGRPIAGWKDEAVLAYVWHTFGSGWPYLTICTVLNYLKNCKLLIPRSHSEFPVNFSFFSPAKFDRTAKKVIGFSLAQPELHPEF